MTFSPEVTAGQIITAIAFLFGGVVAYAKFTARIAVIEVKVDEMWRYFFPGKAGKSEQGGVSNER